LGPSLKLSRWRSLPRNIFWQHPIFQASCRAGCRSFVLDLFCGRGSAGRGHQLHRGRYVRWSASLLAILFLIIVATVDLPTCQTIYMSAVLDAHGTRTAFAGERCAGGQPMVTREIGRRQAHRVGPVNCCVYLHLLCDRALSLPRFVPEFHWRR